MDPRILCALTVAALASACGSDSSAAGNQDSGIPEERDTSDGGAPQPEPDPEDDYEPAPCEPTSSAKLVLENTETYELHLSEEAVFFVDTAAGEPYVLGTTHAIRKVSLDGSKAEVLYTAPDDHQVVDLELSGKDVYFLMNEPTAQIGGATFVYRMPQGGGEPIKVSGVTQGYDNYANLVGADEDSVYVHENRSNEMIFRVSKSDGTETLIADVPGTKLMNVQLFEGKIWFNPSQGLEDTQFVESDATGPAAQRFSEHGCYGDMSVTPGGIFCGEDKFDDQGEFVDPPPSFAEGSPPAMSRPFGDSIFFYSSSTLWPRIDAYNVITGAQESLVCKRDSVQTVVANADSIFWLEINGPDDERVKNIYRAARK